jgi:hypothetical protein
MAEALGVELDIVPNPGAIKRPRKNKHGEIKSPFTGESLYIGPHRFRVYTVQFSFVNNADGFEVNDMKASPATNLHHATPWGFTESFRRGIRTRLARMVRDSPFQVKRFVLKKTVYSE